MDSNHGLYVPVEGMIEVMHSSYPIDGRRIIRLKAEEAGMDGAVATIPVDVDGDQDCELNFLAGRPDSPLAENVRARAILVHVTTLHMKITGPAIFVGLTHERVHDILSGVA